MNIYEQKSKDTTDLISLLAKNNFIFKNFMCSFYFIINNLHTRILVQLVFLLHLYY